MQTGFSDTPFGPRGGLYASSGAARSREPPTRRAPGRARQTDGLRTPRHGALNPGNGEQSGFRARDAESTPVRRPTTPPAVRSREPPARRAAGNERQAVTLPAPSPRGAPEPRLLFPCGCRDSGACRTAGKPAKSFAFCECPWARHRPSSAQLDHYVSMATAAPWATDLAARGARQGYQVICFL